MYKDTQGRFLTHALFYETKVNGYDPVFTLKEYDNNGCKSLKQLYLDIADPTEYKFALKVFGSWRHWQKLLNNKAIRVHIDEWREELEIKLRSIGVRAVRDIALDTSSKGQLQAAKYLAEKGWEPKTRGAPSKAEKVAEVKKQTRIINEVDNDFERIFGKQ